MIGHGLISISALSLLPLLPGPVFEVAASLLYFHSFTYHHLLFHQTQISGRSIPLKCTIWSNENPSLFYGIFDLLIFCSQLAL